MSRISVENLDNQAQDVRETRAAAFAGDEAPVEHAARPAAASGAGERRPTAADASPLGVVAVVAGDGLAAIFRDFGVAAVVRGGQTANPSTGELLAAIAPVAASEILSCRTTRTSSSRRVRWPRCPSGRSSSSRPETPPRGSRRSWRWTRGGAAATPSR